MRADPPEVTAATTEDVLRALVQAALRNAAMPQAQVARDLNASTKHINQMLTGRAPLTLTWAERILALTGHRLTLDAIPNIDQEQQ